MTIYRTTPPPTPASCPCCTRWQPDTVSVIRPGLRPVRSWTELCRPCGDRAFRFEACEHERQGAA